MICDMNAVLPCPDLPPTMWRSPRLAKLVPLCRSVHLGGVYGLAKSSNSPDVSVPNHCRYFSKSGLGGFISSSPGSGIPFSFSSLIVPYMFYGLTPQVVIVWRSLGDGYLSVLITKSGLFLSQPVRQHRLASISGWRSEWLVLMFTFSRLSVLAIILARVGFLLLLSRQIFLAVTFSPHRVTLRSRHVTTML